MARNRPIQEGLIDQLGFNLLFGNYLTGQIIADFLDEDDQPDIATSDRQRLIEDDPRVIAFKDKVRNILNTVEPTWRKLRSDKRASTFEQYPEVASWLNSQGPDYRKTAKKLLDRVAQSEDLTPDQRLSMIESNIVAFERLKMSDKVAELEKFDQLTDSELVNILSSISEFEKINYGHVVADRLEVIDQLDKLLTRNEKENPTRDFIYQNPWLLDPQWERASWSVEKEQEFKKLAREEFNINFDDDREARSRIDLRYLPTDSEQVIVEFKRYGVQPDLDDILKQVRRYAEAMTRLIDRERERTHKEPSAKNDSNISQDIRVRIVVSHVKQDGQYVTARSANNQAKAFNAKFLYYSDILKQSKEKYQEFLDQNQGAKDLRDILGGLRARRSKPESLVD